MDGLADRFVGDWAGPVTTDGTAAVAHWTVRRAHTHALHVAYEESLDGRVVVAGLGVHAWQQPGVLRSYWFDSVGTPWPGSVATFDDDTLRYAGPLEQTRLTYRFEGAGFTFTIERTADGHTVVQGRFGPTRT